MDLRNQQIKDTYANLTTIGTTAGSPTTGTLQNGAGSNVTTLTIAGTLDATTLGGTLSTAAQTNITSVGTLTALSVNGTTALQGAVTINESGANVDFRVEGDTYQNLLLVDASTDRVAIGTSSPSELLHVNGIGRFARPANASQYLNINLENGNAEFDVFGGINHIFKNAGSEKMRIDSSGNVGIGTSSPLGGTRLHVQQNSNSNYSTSFTAGTTPAQIVLRDTSDTATYTNSFSTLEFVAGSSGAAVGFISGVRESAGASFLSLGTGISSTATERMRITSTGGVGIGTTTPASKLDVNGDITIAEKIIHSGDTNTAISFPANDTVAMFTGGLERLRVTDLGRVGINTTSPGARLHVEGFVSINTPTAAVELDVTGSIRASSGILFGTDTAAANELDDYEEGTWTPVYAPSTGSFTSITMDVISATYTKIGNTVHLFGYIRTDAVDTTGGSGGLKITGLPFTPATNIIGTGAIGAQFGWTTNMPTFGDLTSSGIFLRRTDGSGTTYSSIDVTNMTNAADSNRVSFAITYQV